MFGNYEVLTVVLNVTFVEKKAMPFNAAFWNKMFSLISFEDCLSRSEALTLSEDNVWVLNSFFSQLFRPSTSLPSSSTLVTGEQPLKHGCC